jgi:glutathione synthase/RimK-type ligase-like ATP-grasp enzyme
MKTVLLIGYEDAAGKNDIHAMRESFAAKFKENIRVEIAYWDELLFEIKKDHQLITRGDGTDISEFDLVICINWYKNGPDAPSRDIAYAAALYLKSKNTLFWNEEMAWQRSTTKLSAMMQLALNGLDVPYTLFSLDPELLSKKINNYPCILKSIAASRGRDNYLINSEEEKRQHLNQSDEPNKLMFQEFVPNDGDLRIVCFDSKPAFVMKRQRQDNSTHLNNTSQGGTATQVPVGDLGEKTIQDCKKICDIMGRNIAGIDLLVANDGSSRQVFLEVNAIPQLSTGAFVEEKMSSLAEAIENYLTR